MKENVKNSLKKYLVAIILAGVAAFGIMSARGLFSLDNAPAVMACISDGLFVAGFLFAGIGALIWLSSTGTLDIISYGFKSLLVLFTPYKRRIGEGGFYEYKVKQREKRKGVPFQILWVGLGYVLLSLLFTVIYYNIQ